MALPSKVIVTGAARGIGRAVALKLAIRGAHIAVWDVQTEGVKETAEQCHAQGAIVRACTVDVGDTGLREPRLCVPPLTCLNENSQSRRCRPLPSKMLKRNVGSKLAILFASAI